MQNYRTHQSNGLLCASAVFSPGGQIMLDNTLTILKLFIVVSGLIYVIKIYRDANVRQGSDLIFIHFHRQCMNVRPDPNLRSHSPTLRFEGKLESVFELTPDHLEPDFKLFILHANESQGSWLVAGLNHWRERT
jgi:hypothetical protein